MNYRKELIARVNEMRKIHGERDAFEALPGIFNQLDNKYPSNRGEELWNEWARSLVTRRSD